MALHFDRITATEVIALASRTQIDLLKPSERVERTTDTLHHYHKPAEAPSTPKSSPGCGIGVEIVWKYLFPSLMEFWFLGVSDPESRPRVRWGVHSP